MEEAKLNLNQEGIESETPYLKQHNTFLFEIQDERKITFSSEFDSGNCGNVQQTSHFEYDIYTAADRDQGTQQEGYSKSWFFFCVKGFKPGEILKLNIQYVHMLWSLWNNKATQNYHPVYKVGDTGEYLKLSSGIQIHMEDKNRLVLTFEFLFEDEKDVYFSFSYPYQYFRGEKFVKNLAHDYANDPDIYLHSEVIVLSPQQRNVHLLTISSRQGITDKTEDWLQSPLFPNRDIQNRPFKFKTTKPYVLITARVHPGETPSSYALEGIVKFLLNRNDARAALLRHFFVFLIVPMLNPDGVYHGHYRMDVFNNNLNRFYKIAEPIKQPSIFGIINLVENLHKDKRLFFYIDLHAHAGKKGHFMYGNAFEDLVMQIESQTFAKVLSLNCSQFEYNYCNFSKKHMKARDKFEEMTKEGCGRVQVLEMTNLIHTFTLECGFHQSSACNVIPPPTNENFRLNEKLGLDGDEQSIEENKDKKDISVSFSPQSWENVGKAVVISILDVFEKNPYSRIPNSLFKTIENIRRSVGWDCARLERFRQDPLAYKKARKTQEFIHQAFFGEFERKNVFSFQHKFFKDVLWPEDLQGNFLKRYNSESIISLSSSANKKRTKPRQSAAIRSKATAKNITNDNINTEDKSELIGDNAQNVFNEKKKSVSNLDNYEKEMIQMADNSIGNSAEPTAKCYELYRLLGGNASKRQLLEQSLMKSSERGKNYHLDRYSRDNKKMDDSSLEIQENSYRILQCKKAVINEKSQERADISADLNEQGQCYDLSKRRRKKSGNSLEQQYQQQQNMTKNFNNKDDSKRQQQSSRQSKSLKSNSNSSYYQEHTSGLESSNCGVEQFGGWKFEQMMPNVSNRKQILKRSFGEERLHRQLEDKSGRHVSSSSSSCMSLKDILSNGISSIASSSSSLIQRNQSNRRSVNGYEMLLQQQQEKKSMIQKQIHQDIMVSGEINSTNVSSAMNLHYDQKDNTATATTNHAPIKNQFQGSQTGSADSQNTDGGCYINSQLRKEEIPFRNSNNENENNQEVTQLREDENIIPPKQHQQKEFPQNRHEIKEFKCFNIMDYTLFQSNNLPSLSVPPKTQINPPPSGNPKSSVFQKCDALFVQPLQQATLYGKHRRSRDSNPSSMLGSNTINHQKRNQVLQKSCKLIEGIFNKILHKKLDLSSQNQQQQQANKSVSQNIINLDINQGNRNNNMIPTKIGSASPTQQKQEFKQLPLSNKKEIMQRIIIKNSNQMIQKEEITQLPQKKRGGDSSVPKDVSMSKNSFSEDFRLPGIPSKKGDRQGGTKSSSLQPRQSQLKNVI